jgi:hypothetical protein
MSRTTLAALALTAALGAPTAVMAAKPPQPGKTTTPTLAAAPAPIAFGGSTTLTGKGAAGQPVVVEASPAPFTAYKQVATTTTANNGGFAVTVKPGATTRYRATVRTSPPQTSNVVTVGVRLRVGIVLSDPTPRRGARVTFSGRVYPAHDGALVSIQKRTSTGSFTTIARTRLLDDGTSRSRYSRSLRVYRSGVFRVRASNNGDASYLSGLSRTRTITVH